MAMEAMDVPKYESKFEQMDGVASMFYEKAGYENDYQRQSSDEYQRQSSDEYRRQNSDEFRRQNSDEFRRASDDYRSLDDSLDITWDEKDFEKERRKSYTCYFKLKVVQFAEESSNSKAAEEFDVHRRRVQEWRMQKHKLIEQISHSKGDTKRLSGGGRKVKSVERRSQHESLEKCLTSWLQGQLHMGYNISAELVLNEAKACYPNNSNYATMKWAKEFLKQIKCEVFQKKPALPASYEVVIGGEELRRRGNGDPYKREKVLKALFAKTYSIRDWLDGTVDR